MHHPVLVYNPLLIKYKALFLWAGTALAKPSSNTDLDGSHERETRFNR